MNSPPAGKPMLSHALPGVELRPPQRTVDAHVFLELDEITQQQDCADHDRDGAGKSCAHDAERTTGAPAGDEDGREHHVDHQRDGLDQHRGLYDARATQRRYHRDRGELQGEARQEPVKIGFAGARRRCIGADLLHVEVAERVAAHQQQHPADRGDGERLVEDETGIALVLASHRVRNERDGAHAESLCQRQDQERDRARRADARERGPAETRHEVQVHDVIERLDEHPGADEERHLREMSADRALGQVFHWGSLVEEWGQTPFSRPSCRDRRMGTRSMP